MISIKKNSSFPQWTQVFAFGQFIDEVQGKAKALRIARSLAQQNSLKHINYYGKLKRID